MAKRGKKISHLKHNDLTTQQRLLSLNEQQVKLEIEKSMILDKALKSSNVNDVYSAQKYLKSIQQNNQQPSKSYLIDPDGLSTQGDSYREKYYSLSYEMLRKMSKLHVVNAILKTRKQQIASFSDPQKDKFQPGFLIQKKNQHFNGQDKKLSKKEEYSIEYATQFILDCGSRNNLWGTHTFETFLRLIVDDSLSLDQATFEITRDRLGRPTQFFATDGATYRLADYSHLNEHALNEKRVNGYLPYYVQVHQSKVWAEFYPWELCMGIRNPTTDIIRSGYGCSELEDLIKTITAILNADQYNANFFKSGSNPRGILKYSGNINTQSLSDFREHWNAQVSGVNNMHKIPVINADKVDWVNTHETNKDMEYSKYYEFLVKLCSAVYTIDPSEFGFYLSGGAGSSGPMFEGNNEYRIKYSRDKGLRPLLKIIQFWINKYIISQLDPSLEFIFVGFGDQSQESELDRDIKEVGSITTLNEIRARRNMPPLKFGDMPLNGIYSQQIAAEKAEKQQQQQMELEQSQQSDDSSNQEDDSNQDSSVYEEDPFVKSLNNFLISL